MYHLFKLSPGELTKVISFINLLPGRNYKVILQGVDPEMEDDELKRVAEGLLGERLDLTPPEMCGRAGLIFWVN